LQDEPMKKLIDSFAKDMGWNEKATKLLFDGEVVAPMTTPDDLGLEDDDILDASSK
jgi:small ubiquitin-related modifier